MQISMGVVTKVTLRKRRNEYREFVIRAYTADGKRYPDGDYHTDQWDDAESTYHAMLAALAVPADYSI